MINYHTNVSRPIDDTQFIHNNYSSTDLLSEEWRAISDFPGYQVSNIGRVKSTMHGERVLRPLSNNGYLAVILTKHNPDGTTTKQFKQIHTLVAQEFIPNPDPQVYTQVNHINEKKNENVVTNLEWCTPSGNIQYGTRWTKSVATSYFRQYNYIKATNIKTGEIHLFDNTGIASNTLNIYTTHINLALRHMYASGINIVKGYRFEYQDKNILVA